MKTIKDLTDEKKVYSPTEVAEYLGIGKTMAYAMFNEPDFPCFQIGRRKFVLWSELYKWLKENKKTSSSGKDGGVDE